MQSIAEFGIQICRQHLYEHMGAVNGPDHLLLFSGIAEIIPQRDASIRASMLPAANEPVPG